MSLLEQFPGSPEAFDALQAVVGVYRREGAKDAEGLELEVRFGHAAGPRVITGVSAEAVDRVMALLQTNPELPATEWEEVQDVFFDADGAEHRSRTRYDTDRLCLDTHVVIKHRLAECQVRCGDAAFRVVVSREAARSPSPDDLVTPKHVRLQQRKSVGLVSAALGPQPTWSVDFGMVWSGGSKVQAERRQMLCERPEYTLELELADSRYVDAHTDAYVACSLALKVADLAEAPAGRDFFLCAT